MNIDAIDPNVLIVGGVGLLGLFLLVIAITKIQALSKSIQRLADQIPGTGMTAKELGSELSGTIESSFQKYMPQPEKVSAAITSSVETSLKKASADLEALHKKFADGQQSLVGKFSEQEKASAASLEKMASSISSIMENSVKTAASHLEGINKKLVEIQGSSLGKFAEQEKVSSSNLEKMAASISGTMENSFKTAVSHLDGLNKKLVESQGSVLEKWVAHEKNSAGGLDSMRKALESASQQMGLGLTGGSEKMMSSLDGGAKKLADALGSVAAKLDASLQDHSDKTTKASAQLSAQLEKIAALEKDIDKLLHLQQATEGTLKSVTATDEFKNLVKALRDHLQASDAVLREVAKPRTIRLVESEV